MARDIYQMGSWRIDPRKNLIRNNESERRIDHKHMQVLQFLMDHAGREIAKEQLILEVWEGKAVSEDVLSVAVSQIRKALGDKARQPVFIKTITGFGYCLIADVHKEAQPTTVPTKAKGRWPYSVLIGILILISGFIWWQTANDSIQQPERIAVLPLANLTGSEDKAYLAAGATEALINELARLEDVRVTSRTSVVGYADTRKTLPQIARELKVQAIVEGAVQQSGDHLIISLALVNARDDEPLWADSFSGREDDVLLLWRQAAEALAASVSPKSEDLGRKPPTTSGETYDNYLEARYRLSSSSPEQWQQALSLFEETIRREPDFAPGYVGLAQARMRLNQDSESFVAIAPELKTLLYRALELDADLAEAHCMLGDQLFLTDWNIPAARESYLRAYELSPHMGGLHFRYAQFLLALGRFDEALVHVRIWREQDPLAYSAPTVAWIFNMSGRYDEAVAELERLDRLGIRKGSPMYHSSHLRILENMGREEDAFEHYLKLFQALDYSVEQQKAATGIFEKTGLKGLNLWLLEEKKEMGDAGQYKAPLSLARYAAAAGKIDEAFIWLEEAYQQRQMELLWVNVDPKYEPLRSDPRFTDLVKRMGLL